MATCFAIGKKLYINYTVDGDRKRKTTGLDDTKENRKLVETTIIPKLSQMIVTGEIHKKKPKIFEHYYMMFLKRKDAHRSYHIKKHAWEKLNSHFKDKNIDEITRLDIKQYLANMPIKSNSKGVYKGALVEIFDMAVDDGVLNTNPALNIKLPSDAKKEVDYFTKDEVALLLENSESELHHFLLLALYTGMRPEEILGLQMGDIQEGKIDIKRVRTCGRIDHPKTRNAIRRIPCPAFVIEEIKTIKNNHIFLFGDNDDVSCLHDRWWRLLKKCNMDRRKIYSCRHTFATYMLQDGVVSINELAGLLGHSTPKVTLTHYASVIDAKTIDLDRDFDLFVKITSKSKNEKSANTYV